MSEQELAEGCKKGDNRARKELYELFAQPMLCLCFRYVADLEQAQDLLHDGFLKVFSSISSYTYQGEGSLRAWMSRVFTNLALGFLRANKLLPSMMSCCFSSIILLILDSFLLVPSAFYAPD